MKPQKIKQFLRILWVFGIMLCILLICSANYLCRDWGKMRFETVVYQLTSPLQGTNREILWAYLTKAALPAGLLWLLLWLWLFFQRKTKKSAYPVNAGITLLSAVFLIQSAQAVGLPEFIGDSLRRSRIFEAYYVDPKEVSIEFEEKKNLLCIYMESMEHTYASREEGGAKEHSYIPGLRALAKEGVSFSDAGEEGRLGGLHMSAGTGWTMAGLLAQSAGIPYKLPLGEASAGAYLPGVTTLGDLLKEQGYGNYFMCGSAAEFGGRRSYYEQHGGYQILDYDRALRDGVIPEDYHEFWGFEDRWLYAYAKETLARIAKDEAPFHFAMLTVDSHHPEGYQCALCPGEVLADSGKYAAAIACSDNQIMKFLEWVQAQSWYEDTIVVIAGDHLSMNATFFETLPEGFERRVYNCILNTDRKPANKACQRVACTLDLFPTVLAAMGAKIEGDRLGLGTNLFSGRPTLAEELGWEAFNRQLAGNSAFYRERFLR
ncbi:MAG: LTA synthase family protein [Lachnospiraceae bacterium]|nr:LTA synthase family protein [Lachnospiraceae bacterium]